jgi:tetratricopeptide (TPR) repeat protein
LESWERDRALGLAAWKYLSKTGRPRPAELIPLLAKTLERAPADGTVLRALGSIAADNQLADQARNYYERAREIPDAEEAALSGLLDLYYLASQRNQALACAERLLAIDPGDARVHAIRADLLSALGRDTDAIDAAREALQLNPTLVPVREWLVEACRRAGRDEKQHEHERILERMKSARPPRR